MSLPAIPEPDQIDRYPVVQICTTIRAWAESATDVAALKDTANKLSAIDRYLELTSKTGRAEVAATQRRLEVRIGVLLGPAQRGNPNLRGDVNRPGKDLTHQERNDFRDMAARQDVVEDVIAESTDKEPPSRGKVLDRIRRDKPNRSPLPDAVDQAGWQLRKSTDRLLALVEDDRWGVTKAKVAGRLSSHLRHTIEACQGILDEL